jgi:mannosyltransferase
MSPSKTPSDRASALPVILWTAVAAVLLITSAAINNLNFDDGFSIAVAQLSWGDLFSYVSGDGETNMAFYYALLKVWSSFGDGLLFLRMLSVLALIATVPVLYRLATLLFDRSVASIATALFALNGLVVYHATNIRSYGFIVLLVTLSTLLFVSASRTPSRRNVACYVVVAALSVYFHVLAVLVPLGHVIGLWIGSGRVRPAMSAARIVVMSAFGFGAMVVPFFAGVLRSDQESWIPEPTLRELGAMVELLTGGVSDLTPVRAALMLIVVALWMFAVVKLRSKQEAAPVILLISMIAIPVGIAFVESLVSSQVVFNPPYLVVSLPPAILLTAAAINRLRGRIKVGVLVVVIALLAASTLDNLESDGQEQWDEAAQYVDDQSTARDAAVFSIKTAAFPFAYYDPALEFRDAYDEAFDVEYKAGATEELDRLRVEMAELKAEGHEQIWVVVSHASEGDEITRRIAETCPPTDDRRFDHIHVLELTTCTL